jgi:hypothetical protein
MSARWQISILVFAFFVCCMFCHGELYRRRPDAAHLTSFYFSISIGGALGGVFVSLLAPHIFSGFWEFWLGLLTCYVLVLVRLFRDRESWLRFSVVWLPIAILLWAFSLAAHEHVLRGFQRRQTWLLGALAIGTTIFAVRATLRKRKAGVEFPALARVTRLLLVALFAMCGSIVFVRLWVDVRSAEWQGRNFYGVLRIRHVMNEEPKDNGYALFHGNTLHGFQFEDPARALEPTTYFGPKSGIGVAIQNHAYSVNKRSALRVGIVGLGAGTIAAYGQPGDDFRFYEINEDVVHIARGEIGRFSFLSKSPAAITVVPGDARISLERELQTKGSQNFDILVLDAFNSDAIPVHLLTTEAIQLYLHHLHDEHSVLALHISNRSLDLVPVVKGLAEHFHLKMERIISPKRGLGTVSEWMVLSYDPEFFARPNVKAAAREITPKRVPLWTDDYSNLLRIMQ